MPTQTSLTDPAGRAMDARPTPVHVVVLAAGRGSRLGGLGEEIPKWLLPVGGRTIAERHLEGIEAAGDAVASVRVVVGHAAQTIHAELAARGAHHVGLVRNPEFSELNNWWSVLRALRELPEDGPVVIINADLLLDPAHVTAFLEAAATGPDDGLLAVDLERELTDESMKVSRRPCGALDRIGKVGVDPAAGEYIGILMARGATLRAFRAQLEAFVGHPERANEWYEGAVGRIAAEGFDWAVWPMPSSAWVEIDDDRDLEAARALDTAR